MLFAPLKSIFTRFFTRASLTFITYYSGMFQATALIFSSSFQWVWLVLPNIKTLKWTLSTWTRSFFTIHLVFPLPWHFLSSRVSSHIINLPNFYWTLYTANLMLTLIHCKLYSAYYNVHKAEYTVTTIIICPVRSSVPLYD